MVDGQPHRDRVGVDVGGTFTDFVFVSATGEVMVRKRPSTPHDPSESVLAGLQEAREEGILHPRFALVHGTTVATNALLERRGAKTALLTTAGFRDVLEIGRQHREHLYTFHPTKPLPLIPREQRYELSERVDWQGETLLPLDAGQADTLLDRLQQEGYASLGVCLLFSYLNPEHERTVGEKARQRGFSVSLSCEIAPEPREYERSATTAANAFVAPIMARYLGRLEARLQEAEGDSLRVMQSNGGALSAREAAERAIKTALSGPAGGIVAAAQIGTQAGYAHLLTFDMGGTSTDVALIQNGQCPIVTQGSLGGMPLRTPLLDIHTVGAGGGSLARVDAAGGLRVGPQSAGADPGPVAYGRGETLTVTDANLLLGRLPSDVRLGGRVPLDGTRVRSYFARFAAELGSTPEAAALGIVRVANAAMARALRHISTERGHDPTRFTLLSFGGAGGLHACGLADALGMTSILIPRFPGAFSALGLALADTRREFMQALPISPRPGGLSQQDWEALMPHFERLLAEAERVMADDGFAPDTWHAERSLDLRYVGQSFDLRVPLPAHANLNAALASFHALHLARYGHADAHEPVEAVAVRLVAVGSNPLPRLTVSMPSAPGEPIHHVALTTAEAQVSAPVFLRDSLAAGQTLQGPALILQTDATTYLAQRWHAAVDAEGNLRLHSIGKDLASHF
ncbi:MAG TPA: hydantoinase/oxoprolinase family protein [Chthonomonadaceae bacterium]|nr:hydantoinase/oxoprolinase family protein [Chthonomonadaceae bacterium]